MTTFSSQKQRKRQALDRMLREDLVREPRWAAIRETATQIVPGFGNLDAQVAIVGEAPGEVEDLKGRPFVGPAGEALAELMKLAGLARRDVWTTNLVKYRPTGSEGFNRTPTWQEATAGKHYLRRELAYVHPWLVVLCGRTAYQAVRPGASVMRDHGRIFKTSIRSYVPMFHPAACLYNDEWMSMSRDDWSALARVLTSLPPPVQVSGNQLRTYGY